MLQGDAFLWRMTTSLYTTTQTTSLRGIRNLFFFALTWFWIFDPCLCFLSTFLFCNILRGGLWMIGLGLCTHSHMITCLSTAYAKT